MMTSCVSGCGGSGRVDRGRTAPGRRCRAGRSPGSFPSRSIRRQIEIRHHRHPHSLEVLGTTAEGYSLDLRSAARFVSADPRIATVDAQGWVRPKSSGKTQVIVHRRRTRTMTVPVAVTLPAVEPPTSFLHEVMPVLTAAVAAATPGRVTMATQAGQERSSSSRFAVRTLWKIISPSRGNSPAGGSTSSSRRRPA